MPSSMPQKPPPGPRAPRTVDVVLTGLPADLFKVVFYITQVTSGQSPALVLHVLGLAAINTTAESGRGYRAVLTLELTEAS